VAAIFAVNFIGEELTIIAWIGMSFILIALSIQVLVLPKNIKYK